MGISGGEEDRGTVISEDRGNGFLPPFSSAGNHADHQLYLKVQTLRDELSAKDRIIRISNAKHSAVESRIHLEEEKIRNLEQELQKCKADKESVSRSCEIKLSTVSDEYESRIRTMESRFSEHAMAEMCEVKAIARNVGIEV